MAATVVNLKHGQIYDVYIGRAMPRLGLKGSPWANPFKIDAGCSREMAIEKYRLWLLAQPHLLARLPELRDKRLGCWCFPEPCHGGVLIELIDALPADARAGEREGT